MASKRQLQNQIVSLRAELRRQGQLTKDGFKEVKKDVKKINTQLNEEFEKRPKKDLGSYGGVYDMYRLYYGCDYGGRVTLKGKVEAIIKHLGISIRLEEGEDSIKVTAPKPKKPAKKGKK